MINKRQLIDANEYPCRGCGAAYCYQNCSKFKKWLETAVDAVSVDEIIFHHILIDENGIPEVKLQFGDRMMVLRREDEPLDIREVVHGRWDVEVGMNYNRDRICPVCNKHIESNYWNYCPNCGARMDGGN